MVTVRTGMWRIWRTKGAGTWRTNGGGSRGKGVRAETEEDDQGEECAGKGAGNEKDWEDNVEITGVGAEVDVTLPVA